MKLIPKIYITLIALFFFSATSFAGPPPAPQKGEPVPPGGPIDSDIYVLLFFALLLGLYKIYQFKNYKKTPN